VPGSAKAYLEVVALIGAHNATRFLTSSSIADGMVDLSGCCRRVAADARDPPDLQERCGGTGSTK